MRPRRLQIIACIVLACSTLPAQAADPPAESPDLVRPLLVGAEIPRLTLATGNGAEFDLNAALSGKPTVLIFYRGGW